MSSTRTSLVAVGVVAVASLAAWWALQGGEPAPDAPRGPAPPKVGTMSPAQIVRTEHQEPYPYGSYEREVNALHAPPGAADVLDEQKLTLANELKIMWPKIHVDLDKASPSEVVDFLREATKDTGVKILTYPDLLKAECDGLTFDIHGDLEVHEVIDEIRAQSSERMKYYTTSQGLYFGGTATVQQCQVDAREALAKLRAKPERESPILDAEFRPDFADAPIIPIHRLIREQTKLEVILDPATWLNRKTLTWHADPMPLRDALDEICKHFGCYYRVRDGRIFILAP